MVLSLEQVVLQNMGNLREPIETLLTKFGNANIGVLTVHDVAKRGLRNVPSLLSDVSSVDPHLGQKIRDVPIRDYMQFGSMYSAFWYSMSGSHGTEEEIDQLRLELSNLGDIPASSVELVKGILSALPQSTPIALLSAVFGLMSDKESEFLVAKSNNLDKDKIVKAAVQDSKKIFAQTISLIGLIYSIKYGDGVFKSPPFANTSWGGSFAYVLGLDKQWGDSLEKIGMVHIAQGKGNVSSQVSHIVGTMGADPFKCISTCITALSAPYHAKASQDAMSFIDDISNRYGSNPNSQQVKDFLVEMLRQGRKIPGIGQAVMKNPDPRFVELYENAKNSEKMSIIRKIFHVVGSAFDEAGVSVNSPNPNVNLILGSYAESIGIKERDFFPLLFVAGRVMDPLSQFVENVVWGSAMQRPASLTTSELFDLASRSGLQDEDLSRKVLKTISDYRELGAEAYESLLVNVINHLPDNGINLFGRTVIDSKDVYKQGGGRNFYRIDSKPRAGVCLNAVITYWSGDNLYLALTKKWKHSSDHSAGIRDVYENIGGYLNTVLSRKAFSGLDGKKFADAERRILEGTPTHMVYNQSFWSQVSKDKVSQYVRDDSLEEGLYREIYEETGMNLSHAGLNPTLISSVCKHRSGGDLTLVINYYSVHLGELGTPPDISPGDDVAVVDFVNVSRIEKLEGEGRYNFFVRNDDGSRTQIDYNNAIEYEKTIRILYAERTPTRAFCALSNNKHTEFYMSGNSNEFKSLDPN